MEERGEAAMAAMACRGGADPDGEGERGENEIEDTEGDDEAGTLR